MNFSWKYLFIVLLLALALEIIAILQIPDGKFHIIACNVGQGDATLIIYKKIQILIDGGPDNKVLNCLGKYLPFWDRELELVILTHPDSDHFTGLSEVFKRYKVDNYLSNKTDISKPEYGVLENAVGSAGVHRLYPYIGQSMKLDLIHLDILNPKIDQSSPGSPPKAGDVVTDESTNGLSIVSLISFGKFKALITGDMTLEIADEVAGNWNLGPIDYIKISHHGSKSGTTDNLLKAFMPKLAVISVGKNMYGHPAKEILDKLNLFGIKYLRTDEVGDIKLAEELR